MSACPVCSKTLLNFEGEPQWCDGCGWNVPAEQNAKQKSVFDRIYEKLGRKFARDLFIEVTENSISRPRMTFSKLAAFLISGFVISSWLFLFLIAAVASKYWPHLVAILISFVSLLLALAAFPKIQRFPKDGTDASKMKELKAVCDEVADLMKTKRVSAVVLSEEFNASYMEYGLGTFKRKVITIGLPLAVQLTPEELVAVLSHETAHGANGDINRGVLQHTALNTLARWYLALRPASLQEGNFEIPFGSLIIVPVNLASIALSYIPWFFYYALLHLTLRSSQEAEYLADRLASEVAGSKEMLSGLGKLLAGGATSVAVQKAALSNADLFAELEAQSQSLKVSDSILIRELRSGLSLDATHPPSILRQKFIGATKFEPKLRLSPERADKLKAELSAFKPEIAAKLIDQYRNSLYY